MAALATNDLFWYLERKHTGEEAANCNLAEATFSPILATELDAARLPGLLTKEA
jgi:hypothetical protein